jgi:hypothetical protein
MDLSSLSTASQVRSAANLLRDAATRLQTQLEVSNAFLGQVAQLQPAARLLPASDALFTCDVSFPGMRVPSLADVQIVVGPNATVRSLLHAPSISWADALSHCNMFAGGCVSYRRRRTR